MSVPAGSKLTKPKRISEEQLKEFEEDHNEGEREDGTYGVCAKIVKHSTFKASLSKDGFLQVSNIAVSKETFYAAGQLLELTFNVADLAKSDIIDTEREGDTSKEIAAGLYTITNVVPVITANGVEVAGVSPAAADLSKSNVSQDYTISYRVTSRDVDAEKIVFSITASGDLQNLDPRGNKIGDSVRVSTNGSVTHTELLKKITIKTTVTASAPSFAAAGQVITFSYTVAGDGYVDFSDDGLDGTSNVVFDNGLEDIEKLKSELYTATASYTITPEDFVKGKDITIAFNPFVATVDGITLSSSNAIVNTAIVTIISTAVSSMKLVAGKSDPEVYEKVGAALLSVPVSVTNTGNTTLVLDGDKVYRFIYNGVEIVANIKDSQKTLEAGKSMLVTFVFDIAQVDIDAGRFTPTIKIVSPSYVTAANPEPVTWVKDTTATVDISVAAKMNASFQVTEPELPSSFLVAGQVYAFEVEVFNDGNVTLTNLSLRDTLGSTYTPNTKSSLAPGKVAEFIGTYIITDDDVKAGFIENDVAVTAHTSCS
jgi:uncharacterized repeat protein (TIGR01451 family)